MRWALKVKSTPFGTQEPFVKPFGDKNNHELEELEEKEHHSHRKTSSPMASPHKEGSYVKMKGGSKI